MRRAGRRIVHAAGKQTQVVAQQAQHRLLGGEGVVLQNIIRGFEVLVHGRISISMKNKKVLIWLNISHGGVNHAVF